MPRHPDTPSLPRAGLEIAPLAALARFPFPPCAAALPNLRLLGASTFSPLVVCSVYQGLLTALRTEAGVRRGDLNRRRQLHLILTSLVPPPEAGGARTFSISLSLSLLRLLLPSLTLPLGVLAVLGIGGISERMFNAFWDGLSLPQRAELRRRAFAAGVNFRYRLDGWEATLEA
jgi:hypothetical protein